MKKLLLVVVASFGLSGFAAVQACDIDISDQMNYVIADSSDVTDRAQTYVPVSEPC